MFEGNGWAKTIDDDDGSDDDDAFIYSAVNDFTAVIIAFYSTVFICKL